MTPRQRHPIGLYVLFFTEMWERFGFYCMEAVFVYYMKASQYEFLRDNASRIYGIYLAGVYASPFFGGLLAEWRLGYFVSILTGGLFMAGGYGLLSLEPAVCFVIGLGCIVIGNGLFKPNISSLVGKLYEPGDPRIDSAFTIFYMGINVGALFSPIVAGITGILVKEHTDWPERYGYLLVFAIAGVGMIIGWLTFFAFKGHVKILQPSGSAAMTATDIPPEVQSKRNWALIVFFVINVLFWMAFKQRANSMALWIKDRTDLTAPDWLASTLTFLHVDRFFMKNGLVGKEFFQSLNPLFVILLSPMLVWLWSALRRVKIDVSTPAKLVLGFLLTASSFAVMWQAARMTPEGQRATSLVIVAFYVLLTAGELCLSPMGLSLVSKLAPARTRAIWMGLFFVSTSVGGYLAGEIYQFFEKWPFADFFLVLMCSSFGAMALMICAYPLINSAVKPVPPKS